ncbi:MAG TPA: DUF1513 domain-containing protein, partial [Burkholderiaceae bacterium]|nr:DUF1513 domain-containing protein [Burkholderiaceae bacterium]
AHGLLPEAGSGLLAVAMRPGAWLMRLDAEGRVVRRLQITDEAGTRRFDGHVAASVDGAWLYTTETDANSGRGWISVRERESLRKVDEWPTHGIDPHQLLLDAEGYLMVANGGIPRAADGRKRDLDRMDSSLVRLNARNGELLGQWRLDDPRSSLRHLAWSGSLLGIALQAEHDDPSKRAQAPVLAVWDGKALIVPSHAADGEGYAGDIAPAPGGGFVLSGQRAGNVLLWRPERPDALQRIAEITEPCALCTGAEGVLMAGGRGVGRWHPTEPGMMLRWPVAMAVDNHWVVLDS